jgi:hypothetical protein
MNDKMKEILAAYEKQQEENRTRIAELMKLELIDEDGYPSIHAHEIIQKWPLDNPFGWFTFINTVWWASGWGWSEEEVAHEYMENKRVKRYNISTGGWSGNESLIRTMQTNIMWHTTWVQSRRGGHYIFEVDIKHDAD